MSNTSPPNPPRGIRSLFEHNPFSSTRPSPEFQARNAKEQERQKAMLASNPFAPTIGQREEAPSPPTAASPRPSVDRLSLRKAPPVELEEEPTRGSSGILPGVLALAGLPLGGAGVAYSAVNVLGGASGSVGSQIIGGGSLALLAIGVIGGAMIFYNLFKK